MKVYWIGLDTPGRLGVSRKPEGDEALDQQMARLAHGMIDHVISLLEPAEAEALGLAGEGVKEVQVQFKDAAGNVSTAADYLKLSQALLKDPIFWCFQSITLSLDWLRG